MGFAFSKCVPLNKSEGHRAGGAPSVISLTRNLKGPSLLCYLLLGQTTNVLTRMSVCIKITRRMYLVDVP